MSHPVDRVAIDAQQRAERQRQDFIRKQLKADVQQLMNLPAGRRILYLYLQWTGVDESPFATNAMQQSYHIGKGDSGKWWLNLLREFCPEKEIAVRQEGASMEKMVPTTEEDPE